MGHAGGRLTRRRGGFDEAMATAQKAARWPKKSGDQELLKRNQELLELYRARQPYHEPASPDRTEP